MLDEHSVDHKVIFSCKCSAITNGDLDKIHDFMLQLSANLLLKIWKDVRDKVPRQHIHIKVKVYYSKSFRNLVYIVNFRSFNKTSAR